MSYNAKKNNERIIEEIKKKRFSLEAFAEMLGTTRQTLSNYLKSDMPLSTFIKICELLQLEPSTFFLENSGTIQNAMNSKNVNQTNGINDVENALLKQENLHLKEKIELLERLVNSYKNT